MNIFFLGPQGSGKGTQARLLAQKHNLFYFDNGAYLRELAQTNEVVKKTIDEGKMVPDKEMASYVEAYFDEKEIWDNIIFDGFPRNIDQYRFFKNWLADKEMKLDAAFVLSISEKETVKRLSGRRMDPKTGAIYNVVTEKLPEGVKESDLVQRNDDKPKAIKTRLKLYHERTEPLIQELKKDTKVYEINGEQPIEKIQEEIEKCLK